MEKVKLVYSDGGKKDSSHADEKLDCTVRALAIVSGTSYEIAHAFMEKRGRKFAAGVPFGVVLGCKYDGKTIRRLPRPHSSVGRYVAEHQTGNYILQISHHVFAVRDGIIYDACSLHSLRHCPVKRIYYLQET